MICYRELVDSLFCRFKWNYLCNNGIFIIIINIFIEVNSMILLTLFIIPASQISDFMRYSLSSSTYSSYIIIFTYLVCGFLSIEHIISHGP